MAAQKFDLIVIGGGPGGYVAAIRAAQLGMQVGLIERENLGGVCLNWGCIPTKTLLRTAEIHKLITRASEFGLTTENTKIDINAIVERSRKVAGKLSSGVQMLMKKNKITVFSGFASLEGNGRVVAELDQNNKICLEAKHIILASGARAKSLPGIAPDGEYVWTY